MLVGIVKKFVTCQKEIPKQEWSTKQMQQFLIKMTIDLS